MRYRHSSHYSSRYRHRRITFGEVVRIILLVLIVRMIGFGTFMVYRAVHAEVVLTNLKKQNEVLSTNGCTVSGGHAGSGTHRGGRTAAVSDTLSGRCVSHRHRRWRLQNGVLCF